MIQAPATLHHNPALPVLARGHVHVWRLRFSTMAHHAAECAALLSTGEQQRAARFVHAPSQNQFTIARGALRIILAHYLDTSPDRLELISGGNGKPELAPPFNAIHFNVSHSHDLALIAVGTGPLGVDVEWNAPARDLEKLAARFFSAHEQAALAKLPPGGFEAAFYRCWTSKEAYIKGLGLGLSYPLDCFSVAVETHHAGLVEDRRHPEHPALWALHPLPAPADYAATLACSYPLNAPPNCLDWQPGRNGPQAP
ncbi:MAG: 4'-phosphopantetheinyl transferase superfamily protein [Candidatus Hydrogenedentes bacterium]|nr:4'-phosphopantetheinyl transferase superfamily protein [Candidatus Hydrogenedentota bacterium]